MSLFCLNSQSDAQQKKDNAEAKILVAYFSCTGNTESVAKSISKATGGTLYKITPKKAYSSADLDWRDKNSRSSIEMNDDNSRPELGGEAIDMNNYLSGKKVIPFATSGGSSINNSVKQLKKLYPEVDWKEGRLFNRGSKQAEEWAKQIITK